MQSHPKARQPLLARRPGECSTRLVMLDAWLPWRQARDPFDGWAGGAQVSYSVPGADGAAARVCVQFTALFDNDLAAVQFTQAVAAWAAASGSAAVPATAATVVSFEACERGDVAANPPQPLLTPSETATLEQFIVQSIGPTDADRPLAVCTARVLLDDPVTAPLWRKVELTPEESLVLEQRLADARSTCSV